MARSITNTSSRTKALHPVRGEVQLVVVCDVREVFPAVGVYFRAKVYRIAIGVVAFYLYFPDVGVSQRAVPVRGEVKGLAVLADRRVARRPPLVVKRDRLDVLPFAILFGSPVQVHLPYLKVVLFVFFKLPAFFKALAGKVHGVPVGCYAGRAVMPFAVDIRYRGRGAKGPVGIVGGRIQVKVRLLVGPVGPSCGVPGTGKVKAVVVVKHRAKGAVLVVVDVQQLLIKEFGLAFQLRKVVRVFHKGDGPVVLGGHSGELAHLRVRLLIAPFGFQHLGITVIGLGVLWGLRGPGIPFYRFLAVEYIVVAVGQLLVYVRVFLVYFKVGLGCINILHLGIQLIGIFGVLVLCRYRHSGEHKTKGDI